LRAPRHIIVDHVVEEEIVHGLTHLLETSPHTERVRCLGTNLLS